MKFMPIAGSFGAKCNNVDLSAILDDTQEEQLRQALRQYKVLVFEDQQGVGPDRLLALARLFGEPETVEHPRFPDVPGYPGVKELITDITSRPEPVESWHTDGATRSSTKAVTVLQAIDVPEYGRDTAFADMEAVFDSLSEPLKNLLQGLVAVHAYGARAAHIAPVEHPVVRVDLVSGAKSLYVSQLYTSRIVGLKADESRALLDLLFAKVRLLEFQLRVSWRPGTIAIWDNEPTQHYVVIDRPYRRVMHRVMAL